MSLAGKALINAFFGMRLVVRGRRCSEEVGVDGRRGGGGVGLTRGCR